MKLSVVAHPNFAVPPFEGYGGTQRGVHDLSRGLAKRGHQVVVCASGDSTVADYHPNISLLPIHPNACARQDIQREQLLLTHAAIEQVAIRGLKRLIEDNEVQGINLRWEKTSTVRAMAELAVPLVVSIPSILTEERVLQLYHAEGVETGRVVYTAHTEAHRHSLGGHPWIETLPYGIDMRSTPFSDRHLSQTTENPQLPILRELQSRGSDYLLHLGTISRRKGQKTSMEIAKASGLPLIIAGEPNAFALNNPQSYYSELAELADNNVHFFGNANEKEKYELMTYAKATLFCSGFEDPGFTEPFGRVLAESTATGTPVIGYRYGSFPELIDEGFTGFGFDTIEEAILQISKLDSIDRTRCAEQARDKMSSTRFINGMEKLLQRLIKQDQAI